MTESMTQLFYERAKKIIPGGTQLFSKRPELFAPGQWPPYYAKASDCFVWDMDMNKYIDMTTMGIGTCLLGYADLDVNDAVIETIKKGNMSSLNTYLEVELAELLINLHPWAQMVRFARTGGEIMAIAVRIARAYSGRDGIAFCGYHGWHDWYLAANLSDDSNLNGHLLSGLLPKGVPVALRGTIFPFRYNRIEELESVLASHGDKIGTIVMEPIRYQEPEGEFLNRVRELATQHNCVLIFDEITSGWRHALGGVHLELGIEPDMAVFAKAMGNGYPMAAVIGKSSIMDKAQESFISSTYWTEAIGPSATLATIEKMKRISLSERLKLVGEQVRDIWEEISSKNELKIDIEGRPALMHFHFKLSPKESEEDQELLLNTLLSQEMLKRGFLAGTFFYASYAHYENMGWLLDEYRDALDETFSVIGKAVAENRVRDYLDGPVALSGFKRLT